MHGPVSSGRCRCSEALWALLISAFVSKASFHSIPCLVGACVGYLFGLSRFILHYLQHALPLSSGFRLTTKCCQMGAPAGGWKGEERHGTKWRQEAYFPSSSLWGERSGGGPASKASASDRWFSFLSSILPISASAPLLDLPSGSEWWTCHSPLSPRVLHYSFCFSYILTMFCKSTFIKLSLSYPKLG